MQPRKMLTFFIALIFLSGVLTNSVYAGPREPENNAQPAPPAQTLSLTAPQPAQTGIQNIAGSTLQSVTPAELPIGTAFNMCFGFFVQSPDGEFADHVDVNLPDNWTVNSVAPNSVPVANGCPGSYPPVSGINAGNVLYWQSIDYPPQTSCGAWSGTPLGSVFNFCANVTISDETGAPWTLPWIYIGDGWNGEPHSTSGAYGPIGVVLPLGLTPNTIHTAGCPYEPKTITISAVNSTPDPMAVNLNYAVSAGSGSCGGPASVAIPSGSSFLVDVMIEATNQIGQTFTCDITAVDASQPANTDTSQIIYDVVPCFWDPSGWQPEPIVDASPSFWSAGLVGTNPAAAGIVGYVIGGLANGLVIPDLQMFDTQAEAWTQLADLPNPRFSPVAGWINGLIYVAGGYDIVFTSTNDLQVFDPVFGTWDNVAPLDMPAPRGGGAGGVGTCASGLGECLFHVGGGLDGNFASTTLTTYQYDPISNTWTELDSKPAGSSLNGINFGAGIGCGGKIYVGGDFRGYHDFFVLDATQPAGSQWTPLASFPANAGAMSPTLVCDEVNQSIYLIGGDPIGYWTIYSNTVYTYNIAANTWSGPLTQTLNSARAGSVGWLMNSKLWNVGGTVGSGPISPMSFESLTQFLCVHNPQILYLPLIAK